LFSGHRDVLIKKSKFFIMRALMVMLFLGISYWLPQMSHNRFNGVVALMTYIVLMASQWFLLGKEIDHRLKIYYRVNSTLDRLVYRLILGMSFITLYFAILSFFPASIIEFVYWSTWVVLGLFYSWPTRGKIVEESLSSELTEFKYLDSFEKTVLGMILLMFLVSIPKVEVGTFWDTDFHMILSQFFLVNYYPFGENLWVRDIALFLHIYIFGAGIFLLCCYSFFRYFLSRRLSLLGIFSILSSWSYSKILEQNPMLAFRSTYSILWVWSTMWCLRSATYRSGLIIGLIGFWGTLINKNYALMSLLQIIIISYQLKTQKQQTQWFRLQFLKYASFGFFLSLMVLSIGPYSMKIWKNWQIFGMTYLNDLLWITKQKAFFFLSVLGLGIVCFFFLRSGKSFFEQIGLNKKNMQELLLYYGVLLVVGILLDVSLITKFSMMWPVAFLSLVPLEWLFISIKRFRSRRNLIYALYLLICLLDSHFEGRVKILLSNF
jgi:hypothetical protein